MSGTLYHWMSGCLRITPAANLPMLCLPGIVHHLDLRIPPSVRIDLFQICFLRYPKLSDSGYILKHVRS
ncbi:hypothetical protein QYF36_022921 [Acer negundo]|nr:hypothetical protein QYF36_022921 [Acer negundo]